MKLRVEYHGGRPAIGLQEFADKYELEMKVRERSASIGLSRFYCSFPNVEVMERGMLVGICGNGDTVQAALQDYAKQLAGKCVAIGAYTRERRNVDVPNQVTVDQQRLD